VVQESEAEKIMLRRKVLEMAKEAELIKLEKEILNRNYESERVKVSRLEKNNGEMA
jgi:hypothetical protein